MPTEIIVNVATRFVGLVLKYGIDWPKVKSLSPEEEQIIMATLTTAGWQPNSLEQRTLCECGGNPTANGRVETYVVNPACPFTVISRRNGRNLHDDRLATGWLSSLVNRTLLYGSSQEDHQTVIEKIAERIEASQPLRLIQLSKDLIFLQEPHPDEKDGDYLNLSHKKDEDELRFSAGIHWCCGGSMQRRTMNATQDALVCGLCFSKSQHFPVTVQTYGQLRAILVFA